MDQAVDDLAVSVSQKKSREMARTAICLIAKDEQRDIAEWIAYHISCGFSSVIFYDNGSRDRTRDIALSFTEIFDLRLVLWNHNDLTYQKDAYLHACRRFQDDFDWIAFLDSDEFFFEMSPTKLNFLNKVDNSISQILLNWAVFGMSGHRDFPDGLIIENFVNRTPPEFGPNRHTKALVRPKMVRGVSNPHCFIVEGRSVDTGGRDIEWSSTPGPGVISGDPVYSSARINHYFTRSYAHWRRKNARGYSDQPGFQRADKELEIYDAAATIVDRTAVPWSPTVRAVLAAVGVNERGEPVSRGDADGSAAKDNQQEEGCGAAKAEQAPAPHVCRKDVIAGLWRGHDPVGSYSRPLAPLDLQGWGSQHPWLVEAIETIRPRIVVEVGVWKGGSTLAMARRLKDLGLDAAVIAVDTWLGAWDHWINDEWFKHLGIENGIPTLMHQFMSNTIHLGLQDYVVPLPLDSTNAAHVLRHFDVRPNVVHIDGGHDYQAVSSDLRAWWDALLPGGLLIGDNYLTDGGWPDVRRAFDDFFGALGLLPIEHTGGKCRILKRAG